MTKNNRTRQFKNSCNFAIDMVKESKIKVIIITAIVMITFFTGIIVAIKTKVDYSDLERLGVVCFGRNGINTSFFTRLLSMVLILLICFGCSFSNYLIPVAILFLAYRGYLLGVNICLIIAVNGISGIIFSIIIVLPCQMLALAIMLLFYILMSKSHKDRRLHGGCRVANQKMKILIASFLAVIIVCLLEAVLLAIFSPQVILVL